MKKEDGLVFMKSLPGDPRCGGLYMLSVKSKLFDLMYGSIYI
jgi:hypothetical protein